MSRVIIADVRSYTSEGRFWGHGYAVASNFLRIFEKKTEAVVSGGPPYLHKFKEQIIPLPYNVDSCRSSWLNLLLMMLNMRKLFRECRNDTIILQSSGVVSSCVGITLYKKAGTRVFMILYNTEALSSPLKRLLFRLARNKISGILCPNEEVGKAYGIPSCTVPDYIYCSDRKGAHGQSWGGYRDKKYDFCMVGLIWRDKGMVEAARHLAGTPYKVLIAGEVSEEAGLKEELLEACKDADNIELRIGYLSAEDYDAAIRSSRYGILNYSGAYSLHSSGVVFDFLFRGVPIVGRACKTLKLLDDFHVGYTYTHMADFDPLSVLNETVYQGFCRHLESYYEAHQSYKLKVQNFILNEDRGV